MRKFLQIFGLAFLLILPFITRGQILLINQPVTVSSVSCFGNTDGSLTVSIQTTPDIVPPFIYTLKRISPSPGCSSIPLNTGIVISSSATSVTFNDLCDGNYTLSVNDHSMPLAIADSITNPSINIGSASQVTVSTFGQNGNVICFGDASGILKLVALGGANASSGYKFKISGPSYPIGSGFIGNLNSNTYQFNGLFAGTYTIQAQDTKGCQSSTISRVITQPNTALTFGVVTKQRNNICTGLPDGSLSLAATGGTSPYVYSIDGGNSYQVNGDYNNLSQSIYQVRIKDANNCIKDTSITLLGPVPLLLNGTSHVNIKCVGINTGIINFNASGGLPPYLYSIDAINYFPTATFNNLNVGTYNVRVKDAAECFKDTTVVITQPTSVLSVSVGSKNNVTPCYGNNSGSINLNISGGMPNYSILLNPNLGSVTGNVISNLPAGNYNISVSDVNSCVATLTNVNISEPPKTPSEFSLSGIGVICIGKVDTAKFTSVASVPIVNFNWNFDGGSASPGTGAGPHSISWATSGVKSVTLTTTDSNGCISEQTLKAVTVQQKPSSTFSYQKLAYCKVYGLLTPDFGVNAIAGTFSANESGIVLNSITGVIDPLASISGTYVIKNKVTNLSCVDSTSTMVIIKDIPVSLFSYPKSSYCQAEGSATITLGSGAETGVFSVKPAVGIVLDSTTGEINLALSSPGVYQIINRVSNGYCVDSTITNLTINVTPYARFSYAKTSYCRNEGTPIPILNSGSSVGDFSVTPSGLALNNDGSIILASSLVGTYTVKNKRVQGNCSDSGSYTINIQDAPKSDFIYSKNQYCKNDGLQPVSLGIGATAGLFKSTTGLAIDSISGTINISSSIPGTYNVKNKVALGGCADSTQVTIVLNASPDAMFSYGNDSICKSNVLMISPMFNGTAVAGVFTSTPSGLTINSVTGQINVASSLAGSYQIKNSVLSSNICKDSAIVSLVILDRVKADFTYLKSNYCISDTLLANAFLEVGAVTGTFTATPTGLSLNALTGSFKPSTSSSNTYLVTNTFTSGGICTGIGQTVISVFGGASSGFSYGKNSYCSSEGSTNVILNTGSLSGVFTSTPNGLDLNGLNGTINLSSSFSGTYSIKNVVGGSVGLACKDSSTVILKIENIPKSDFYYGKTTYCTSEPSASPSFGFGAAAGIFSSSPLGLSYNSTTGIINFANSNAGAYTITNTVIAGSCNASSTFTVNVINNPLANFSYSETQICKGQGLQFPIFNTGSTSGVFSANSVGLVLNSTTGEIDPSNSLAGNYVVSNRVISGICISIYTQTISIVNAPSIGSIIYQSATYCKNGIIIPTPSGTTPSGIFTSSPMGLVFFNNATGTVNVASSGVGDYTITYTKVSGGCVNSVSTYISILSAPDVPTFSASNGFAFCSTDSTILLVDLPKPNTTYRWYRNASNLVHIGKSYTVKPPFQGNYYVVATTLNSCTTKSITTAVTVILKPTTPFISGACASATPPATLTTSAAFNGLLHYWFRNGVVVQQSNTSTYIATTTGDYQVQVENANGCKSDTSGIVNPFNPIPHITVTTGINPSCYGGVATLTSSSNTGNAWYKDGVAYPTSTTNATRNVIVTSTGVYSLKVNNGVCNGKDSILFTVKPAIPIPVISGNATFCTGSGTLLSVSSQSGSYSNSATYQWFRNNLGNPLAGPNATASNYYAAQVGTYFVQITDNGCTTTSSWFSLGIVQSPSIPIFTSSGATSFCEGGNVIFTITNFNATNTYTWYKRNGSLIVPIGNGQTLNVVATGTYKVIASNGNGCNVTSDSIPVLVNPSVPLFVGLVQSPAGTICPNMPLVFTASPAGQSNYQFKINGLVVQTGISESLILDTLKKGGVVTVEVLGSNTCNVPASSADSVSYIVSTKPLVTVKQFSNLCNGITGTLVASVQPSGAYRYKWVSENTPNLTLGIGTVFNNVSGFYYFITTDTASGCTDTTKAKIIINPNIAISLVTTPATNCKGNGKIVATISGLFGNPTFIWKDAANNILPYTGLNLLAVGGTYKLIVINGNGCIDSAYSTIISPIPFSSLTTLVVSPTTCSANGSITATVLGGSGNYFYNWYRLPSLQAIINNNPILTISAGNYRLVVTDLVTGCEDSIESSMTAPSILTQTGLVTNSTACNLNGKVVVTMQGGSGNYTFVWRNALGLILANSTNILSADAGTYKLLVKDNDIGCLDSALYTITAPSSFSSFMVSVNQPKTCNGLGTLKATTIGGSGNLSYVFKSYITNVPVVSVADSANVFAGTYLIKVFDLTTGCVDSVIKVVNQLPAFGQFNIAKINANKCGSDGVASISISPNVTATFIWKQYVGNSFLILPLSSASVNLPIGLYTGIAINSVTGCKDSGFVTIAGPIKPIFSTTVVGASTCDGLGTITLTVNGNLPNLAYTWKKVDVMPYQLQTSTINNFQGSKGIYRAYVTDTITNCLDSITSTITQPEGCNTCNLSLLLSAKPTTCANGSNGTAVIFIPNGGNGVYEYRLNNSGIFTTLGNLYSQLQNQSVGKFKITVRDKIDTGCSVTDSINITSQVTLMVQPAISQPNCQTAFGSVNFNFPVGGAIPYYFSMDGSAQQLSPFFDSLVAGKYAYKISDANGCNLTDTIVIIESLPIGLAGNVLNGSGCNAAIGTGKFKVKLPDGLITTTYTLSIKANNGVYIDVILPSDSVLKALSAGTYWLKVKRNIGGCADSIIFVIDTIVQAPVVVITASANNICIGNTVVFSINNSASQITNVSWLRNGIVVQSGTSSLVYQTNTIQLGDSIKALITIANGLVCYGGSTFSSNTIKMLVKPAGSVGCGPSGCQVAINATVIPILCQATGNSGVISITSNVASGKPSYKIKPGINVFGNSASFSGLASGSYWVIVRDSLSPSCIDSAQVYIPIQYVYSANVGYTNPTACSGLQNGSISFGLVTKSNGVGGYKYSITSPAVYSTVSVYNNLAVGIYVPSVIDTTTGITPCSITLGNVTLVSQQFIKSKVSQQQALSCYNSTDGIGNIDSIKNGSGLYQYSFNGLNFTALPSILPVAFPGLAAGNTSVYIRDVNTGCTVVDTFKITRPDSLILRGNVVQVSNCNSPTGIIKLKFRLVTAIGNFTIKNITTGGPEVNASLQPDSTLINVGFGMVQVKLTNTSGCSKTQNFFVDNSAPKITTVIKIKPCSLTANGSVKLKSIVGNNPPYIFTLIGRVPQVDSTFTDMQAGAFSYTITDASGCSRNYNDTLIAAPKVDFLAYSAKPASCNANDGTILVKQISGTPPFYISYDSSAVGVFTLPRLITADTILLKGISARLAGVPYQVLLRDGSSNGGCTYIKPVVVGGYQQLAFDTVVTSVKCYGESTGSLLVKNIAGTGPFKLQIITSTGSFVYQNIFTGSGSQLINNLRAGSYNVLFQQTSGSCIAGYNFIVTITQPTKPLTIHTRNTRKTASELNLGVLVLDSVTGGVGPYLIKFDGDIPQLLTSYVYRSLNAGRHTFDIIDATGCNFRAIAMVDTNFTALSPNIFTPNGDGFNDKFIIPNLKPGAYLVIFNRWGRQVYSASSYDNTWDGGNLPDGNYFYQLIPEIGDVMSGSIELNR